MIDARALLEEQVAATVGELDTLAAALAAGELSQKGSRGQQVPNRLLGEVRGHRLVLVKLLAALEGRQESAGDGLDDLRRSWGG
jgi:hypothetical protein